MAIQTQERLLGKVFGRVWIVNQTLQFSDRGQIVSIEDVPKAIGDTNVQGYFPLTRMPGHPVGLAPSAPASLYMTDD